MQTAASSCRQGSLSQFSRFGQKGFSSSASLGRSWVSNQASPFEFSRFFRTRTTNSTRTTHATFAPRIIGATAGVGIGHYLFTKFDEEVPNLEEEMNNSTLDKEKESELISEISEGLNESEIQLKRAQKIINYGIEYLIKHGYETNDKEGNVFLLSKHLNEFKNILLNHPEILEELIVWITNFELEDNARYKTVFTLKFLYSLLAEHYPKINDYLIEGQTISPEGMRLIIQDLKDKGRIPKEENILVFDSYNACAQELIKINSLKVSDGEKLNFTIIVRNTFLGHDINLHVTPFFIEKSSTGTKAVVLDSVGMDGGYPPVIELLLTKFDSQIKVFKYTQKRQTDQKSCPSIAIHDALQISQTKNFMQLVEQAALKKDSENFVEELPPAFMIPTQSLITLNKYLEETPERRNEKIGSKERTLEQIIEKHTRTVANSKRNAFADRKFEKYSQRLVLKAIQEDIDKKNASRF